MRLINESENWKPFFHRTSTWIGAVALTTLIVFAYLVGTSLANGVSWVEAFIRTEEVQADILHTVTNRTIDVDRWTVVRKYGRSSVPECAWDVSRDRVCDAYEQVCVRRDSSGRCTSYEDGACIDWSWEYDFSKYDWKGFMYHTTEFWNTPVDNSDLEVFSDKSQFDLNIWYTRYIVVGIGGKTAKLQVSEFPKSKVCVVRRVRNGNILRLCK